MSSATEQLLQDYETWKRTKAFSGVVVDSPAAFMQERRIDRIIEGVSKHLNHPSDDRYPLEEYLEVEDIDWLKSQGSTEVSVV